MRIFAACLTLASPATAWEFSATPLCMISNGDRAVDVRVAFDPGTALYAIHLTLDDPWPPGPVFTITFQGAQSLSISTDRHELSANGLTLTVTDTGFGNVLNGLQFNATASAQIAGNSYPFALDGAAPAVEAFRTCGDALTG